jgi:hypothetical protein
MVVAMSGRTGNGALMRQSVRMLALMMGLFAGAIPAFAQKVAPIEGGGSLPLGDVLRVAKPYPNLINEVRLALLKAGLKRDHVTCSGQRLSTAWTHLGGQRVAPYECRIGDRSLVVRAVANYFDRNGHKLAGDDPGVAAKATRLAEARLTWQWK